MHRGIKEVVILPYFRSHCLVALDSEAALAPENQEAGLPVGGKEGGRGERRRDEAVPAASAAVVAAVAAPPERPGPVTKKFIKSTQLSHQERHQIYTIESRS
jgi:hypothetical protein